MGEAIIITVISILLAIEGKAFGQFGFSNPLIAGTIVGLVMGDVKTAIQVAIPVQLIFMGAIAVGAALPPDSTLGAVLAVALAIKGISVEAAIAISVPVAYVAVSLNTIIMTLCTFVMHQIDKFAETGNYRGIEIVHLSVYPLLLVIRNFLVVFPAIYYGAAAVQSVLNAVPPFILMGFNVAGKMLPALGFGMLITMVGVPHLMPFLFVGFVLATYLPISLIGVAVLGVCAALYHDYMNSRITKNAVPKDSDLSSLMKD